MDLKNGAGSIFPAAADTVADVVIKTSSNSLVAMFTGRYKPTTAFGAGAIEIKGNMSSAMMLEKLARYVDSKL